MWSACPSSPSLRKQRIGRLQSKCGRSVRNRFAFPPVSDISGLVGSARDPAVTMTLSSFAIRAAAAALSASLLLSPLAYAQQPFTPFARPAPATVAPRAPAAVAPSPRAASCHNGASFDKFLAELKQQAVAQGVSQRALTEAAPYLVYDQGIVNRDRGQRVFGQIFTEFAGRMAANFRMQNGQTHIKKYQAAFAR